METQYGPESACDLGIEIGAENAGLITSNVKVRKNVIYENEKAGSGQDVSSIAGDQLFANAGVRARGLLEDRCTDTLPGQLAGACAATVDGLINPAETAAVS